ADAVEDPAVQQHTPDTGEASRRNAEAALRREQRPILAGMPAREVARLAVIDGHRTIRATSMQIVLLRLASRIIEFDRSGDRGVAAGRPIVTGVELHRPEHVTAHPDVEPLTGDLLDDR